MNPNTTDRERQDPTEPPHPSDPALTVTAEATSTVTPGEPTTDTAEEVPA